MLISKNYQREAAGGNAGGMRRRAEAVAGGGGGSRRRGEAQFPGWMKAFLQGDYFSPCHHHATRKNERNHFCTDCMEGPLCHVGLHEEHEGHHTLQVRRASHMDAVRVEDIQGLADVSSIQTYSINGAKIFFLLCRPQYKVVREALYTCQACGRMVADDVRFCSITCKLSVVDSDSPPSYGGASNSSKDKRRCCSMLAPPYGGAARRLEKVRMKDEHLFDQKIFLKAFASLLAGRLSREYCNAQKPLKKRKFDYFTFPVIAEKAEALDEEVSLGSPVSVLQKEASMNELTLSRSQCSQDQSNSRSTESEETIRVKRRRRKGHPQRSPLV